MNFPMTVFEPRTFFVLHDHHAMPISLFDELFRQEYYEVYPLAMLS